MKVSSVFQGIMRSPMLYVPFMAPTVTPQAPKLSSGAAATAGYMVVAEIPEMLAGKPK